MPDETYEELIEATFAALSNKGYINLRVRDIDSEFAKSRQLINHYFNGKDEVVTELLSYLVAYSEDQLDGSLDDDPLTKLNSEIDAILFGTDMEQFDFWALMTAIYEIQSQAHRNPDHQRLIDQLYTDSVEHFDEIIQSGIDQGVFDDVDSFQIATLIDDLITVSHLKKIYLGYDDAPAKTRDTIDQFVIPHLNPTPDAVSSE